MTTITEEKKKLICGISIYEISAYFFDGPRIIFKDQKGFWVDSKDRTWKFADSSKTDEELKEETMKKKSNNIIAGKKQHMLDIKIKIKEEIEKLKESDLINRLEEATLVLPKEKEERIENPFYEDCINLNSLIYDIFDNSEFLATKNSSFITEEMRKFGKDSLEFIKEYDKKFREARISVGKNNPCLDLYRPTYTEKERGGFQFSFYYRIYPGILETEVD